MKKVEKMYFLLAKTPAVGPFIGKFGYRSKIEK